MTENAESLDFKGFIALFEKKYSLLISILGKKTKKAAFPGRGFEPPPPSPTLRKRSTLDRFSLAVGQEGRKGKAPFQSLAGQVCGAVSVKGTPLSLPPEKAGCEHMLVFLP